MLLGSSPSREGISAAHSITHVTDKCGTSPSPRCLQLCHGAWWGWHRAMVRLSLQVVALPLDRVSPALDLPPLWLSRSWLAKHSAPGRGGRAEGQGVALNCLEGVNPGVPWCLLLLGEGRA